MSALGAPLANEIVSPAIRPDPSNARPLPTRGAAFQRDRARDTRLLVTGYRTIRITDERLDTEPSELAQEIRHLLRA